MGNKLLGLTFRGFTKEIDAASVAERFRHKYGYEPELVHDGKSVWLAGPIGGNGELSKFDSLSESASEFPKLSGAGGQIDHLDAEQLELWRVSND